MENAIIISQNKQLSRLLNRIKAFQRVYYGVEFCQNLIPSLSSLKTAYSLIKKQKKNFTLLTPYVTNMGMKKITPLFDFLENQQECSEVIFNDWGVLNLLKKKYKNLEPVLGRLLTKQRRDPRARDILLNCQKAKKIIDKQNGTTYIVIPKKAPLSLYEHFKASVINMPIFHDFLLDNNIRRVEIDNLAWEMKIEVNSKMRVSVYLPYAYVSTTRLCGLINMTYKLCRKECQDFYLSFKSSSSQENFYIKGNTVFYKTVFQKKKINNDIGAYFKQFLPNSIDRIIWNNEAVCH